VLLKMAYNLRTSEGRKNYRDLDTIKLPRAQRIKDKLYPLEIVGRDGDRVKVHYIGYSSQYDEWRLSSDLETLKIKDSTRGAIGIGPLSAVRSAQGTCLFHQIVTEGEQKRSGGSYRHALSPTPL